MDNLETGADHAPHDATIDRDEAERFLTALDPTCWEFTFQCFDDSKDRRDPQLARVLHGTLARHFNELCDLNNRGAGVFLTVNATDLKGRTAENIVRVRAVFVDLDGAPIENVTESGGLPPHIITLTSPGHYHAYWLVDGMPLDQFAGVQKTLAACYHGDNVHDLPRVLRIPGFVHRKAEPFLSRLLQASDDLPYSWDELRHAFPPYVADEPAAEPVRQDPGHDSDDLKARWQALNAEALASLGTWVPRLFPTAKRLQSGVWRVQQRDLGRPHLQEDLSLDPHNGIVDFGVREIDQRHGRRTPLDLVQEWNGVDFRRAAIWLAQALGRDPGRYIPASKGGNGREQPEWGMESPQEPERTSEAPSANQPYVDEGGQPEQEAPPAPRLVMSSAEFVAGYVPPSYLVKGLLQRRFVYSMTASTGSGKTCIALLLAANVGLGLTFAGLKVTPGDVLYFAGENPDDIRMRWFSVSQHCGIEPEEMERVFFVAGVFQFSEITEQIKTEVEQRELALVIIDTSAVFFEGDDENSNTQLGDHARRLRGLVDLPGGPTVLICAHPTKNAGDENLIPRGGGAFLAEVDGNLTCRKTDSAVELHWQGKFRGPEFAPISFQLETVTHERIKDSDGDPMPNVIAKHVSDEAVEEIKASLRYDELELLKSIIEDPELSDNARAARLGWSMKDGKPYRVKVGRLSRSLKRDGLVQSVGGRYEATEKGKKYASRDSTATHVTQNDCELD